jgi:hypothetical protein
MKLALAADTMLGRRVAERLETASPAARFTPGVVDAAHEADAFVHNLECAISTRGRRHGPIPASLASSAPHWLPSTCCACSAWTA